MTALKLVAKPKKTRAEEILSRNTEEFEFDETEVLRLMGGSAANGDKNDPIVFQGNADRLIRKMVAQYGFDRLPATYGEFQGMQDYCARLDITKGTGIVSKNRESDWSVGGIKMWEESGPTKKYKPVGAWYCAGKLDEIRAFNIAHNVMTQLGKDFNEFDVD